jgi:L-cysteine desulfidase
MTKNEMLELLRQNVVPALGCTEPVCAALAAADASRAAGGTVQKIQLDVSRSLYKNGMSVGIPSFEKVGLKYAAALGACIADPAAGLEIMKQITPDIAGRAAALADGGCVRVTVAEQENGVYARAHVTTDAGEGISVIRGGHTNIVLTQANGKDLYRKESSVSASGPELLEKLKTLTVSEIRALAASASEEELAFLTDGAEMNEALADYGIHENAGIGISGVLRQNAGGFLIGNSLMERIMVRVASATEARLEGCPLSTMSSAGSGSKGIAVVLPIVETARALGCDAKTERQALAFGHLMNEYMNAHIGKLTAICNCAMAASTAAAASLTWLLGGTDEQIGFAVRNMTGDITGMVCDGGKVGCALKLATAMAAAVFSAVLAVNGVGLRPSDGICGTTPEECIQNVSRFSRLGLANADREILNIMLEKETAN